MKRLSIILFIIAGMFVLAGIWIPATLWQCLATAAFLFVAGASFGAAAEKRHQEAVERAKRIAGLSVDPGIIYRETPHRPTKTQAQIDAELAEITKHEGGHQ